MDMHVIVHNALKRASQSQSEIEGNVFLMLQKQSIYNCYALFLF